MSSFAGWKGFPVVVLGRKEMLPVGVLPMVSVVSRPVKHDRLVAALLRSAAFMLFKTQNGEA